MYNAIVELMWLSPSPDLNWSHPVPAFQNLSKCLRCEGFLARTFPAQSRSCPSIPGGFRVWERAKAVILGDCMLTDAQIRKAKAAKKPYKLIDGAACISYGQKIETAARKGGTGHKV
jgi:hypothetical protein